jgi:threonine aldolase
LIIESEDGIISLDNLERIFLDNINDNHKNVPSVVSISQPTECGNCYSLDEIENISKFCKKNGLYLHMDGKFVIIKR